jgi:Interferon-induced transmembrane protein
MTTTPRPNAVEAAKQGHPKAIAVLLNQALKPHGYQAKVLRNEAALRILVEGELAPDETAIVDLIENGLRQLSLDAITPDVQIYGQRLGEALPLWTKSLNLSPADTAPPIFRFDAVTEDVPAAVPAVAPPPRSVARPMTPIGPPEKPPTYTVFAVVMFFLGIFPLTWVGVILSSQVSRKYKQGDYEGAETASQRTKFWCQVNLWIAIPIYVVAGGVIFAGSLLEAPAKRQPTPEEKVAVQRLAAMMEAERQFWVETDKLSPTITMPEDNSTAAMVAPYRYTVTMLDASRVQVTAVPTRKGLHSFTAGSMLVRTSDEVAAESVICRSAKPSMQPVPMPIVIHGGRSATCGPEFKVVDSSLGVGDDMFTPQVSEAAAE